MEKKKKEICCFLFFSFIFSSTKQRSRQNQISFYTFWIINSSSTYIRNQTHRFHLVYEEESILQPSSFHGPNDQRMKNVSRWLNPIKHHIIIRISQQKMPITTTTTKPDKSLKNRERKKRKQNPSDFFIEQWDWRKTCAEQLEKKQRLCTRKHCWHSSSWRTLLLKLQSIDAQVLEAAVNSAALWMIHEIVSVGIKMCKWGCWKIEEYQQRSEAASSWLVTIW